MNTKSIFVVALFCFVLNYANACDICGCFMGITPYDNQSQFAFLHRYRVFNGYAEHQAHSQFFPTGAYKMAHGTDSANSLSRVYSGKDYESYKVFELRGKYFIHRRIELNAVVPLNNNKYKYGEESGSLLGFGDPTLFAGFHLLRRVDTFSFQQRLIAGIGIKAPVGKYNITSGDGDRLSLLMQPGTGSLDGFVYLNYIFGYKNFGTSINSIYKFNGENSRKEKIGNSVTTYCNVFLRYMRGNVSYMPSFQFYYENTPGLFVNGFQQEGTEMNVVMAGPGFDFYYKNFGLNIAGQMKVYEKVEAGNLKSSGRLIVGLNYNFNQRKYLLK